MTLYELWVMFGKLTVGEAMLLVGLLWALAIGLREIFNDKEREK